MVLSGQSSAGEPLGQGSIPLLQPGARKLEGLGQLQPQGTRHCFGGHRPSEAGARLGHSPECGQDVHGPWQGQAGLWVLGIGPAVASVEHGLNVPAADMGSWALDGMGQAGTTSPRDALRAWATLLKFS